MDTLRQSLLGEWLPIRAELDGEIAPDMALQHIRLQLRSDAYQFLLGGEIADAGEWAADALEAQIAFSFSATQGANAGRNVPAIAQLRGDRLRICFGLDGVRPTAFETSAGSARYLVTYRREPA